MSKHIGFALATLFLIIVPSESRNEFVKYKKIEAYEVRAGILMLPSYTSDDRLCEIGLQKLHYTPELIRLEPSLNRKDLDQLIDEFAPEAEKGKRIEEAGRPTAIRIGNSFVTTQEFENISIQIYSSVPERPRKGDTVGNDVVGTIKWKNRACR